MIFSPVLRSIAFPWVLTDAIGNPEASGTGALFSQPGGSLDAAVIAARTVEDGGWGCAQDGYAFYKFSSPILLPKSLLLFGLKVSGVSKVHGRSEGLSIKLDAEHVSAYAAEVCAGLKGIDDNYRGIIRQNIHEIRGINSSLYNTAYSLEHELGIEQPHQRKMATSVVRWSEILRGRIDFMEFIANPEAIDAKKVEVPVYRIFDKIQRCFHVTANLKSINIKLQGSSSSATYGPPVFDVVPYLLLENAIKYSPSAADVVIVINETPNRIYCRVTSMGPRINDSELISIFSSAVRGENAIKSGASGSGLGLAVVDQIVRSVFGGTVELSQSSDKRVINGIPYPEVTFELVLPIHHRSRV